MATAYARLYYQTASKEYIEFLEMNGGVDGLSLFDLWEASKSPPELMAEDWSPRYDVYLPVLYLGE
jgi:hypothetical protein